MTELLDLLARWVHVIAGIMWIGNSMLFNFLDRNLRKRPEPDSYGDIWLLHSGGFYLMEKNKGERLPGGGLRLPTPLHWFKWQAYTTWITGALLLVVVYYVGGRALLEDTSLRHTTHSDALITAVSNLVLYWATYELIWRTVGKRWPRIALALSLLLLVAYAVTMMSTLSGRAALIHIGALLGTIMAGNVAFTIMPSQRELVAALAEGREPSQVIADRAKTRSIHNNYITFPVIALMVSAHFPSLYAHNDPSLPLILIAGGALVRHFMNVRFTNPRWGFGLAVTAGATIGVLALAMGVGPVLPPHPFGGRYAEADSASVKVPDVVTFADARRIIDRRCAACHSITPSDVSLGRTPVGVAFDTPQQIVAMVARIKERAVVQKTMPPGNKTMITDAERAILAKWIESGAATR